MATLVTEPFLPPLEDYQHYLEKIWDSKWLTNQGPLTTELEERLTQRFNLERSVHAVANGGLGLQIALRSLGVGGELVTTPFSYVATVSCPLWDGCQIRYAEIDRATLTICPDAVEASITAKTEAILATHVFGNPCDVERLSEIANRHNLALIYDAAHAFDVTYKGRSILEWGDASMVSLHATKIFHSVEGGLVYSNKKETNAKMEWMRRFGHNGPNEFHGVGINAKLSEFHAAMALCNFDYMESIVADRKALIDEYNRYIEEIEGIEFAFKLREAASWNYSYYPILFESQEKLQSAVSYLAKAGFEGRRYFYPSLDTCFCPGAELPISNDVSSRVLCLPLASSYKASMAKKVCRALSNL